MAHITSYEHTYHICLKTLLSKIVGFKTGDYDDDVLLCDTVQMVPEFQGFLHCHYEVYPKNGTNRLLQNVGIQLQNSTVSHTRLLTQNIVTHNFNIKL